MAHQERTAVESLDPDATDERERRHQRFAELVRAGRHEELVSATVAVVVNACAGQRGLSLEIGAMRLLLQRVIETELLDGDTRALSQTITKLIDTILRALRLERELASSLQDEIYDSITRIFAEEGLLEDA